MEIIETILLFVISSFLAIICDKAYKGKCSEEKLTGKAGDAIKNSAHKRNIKALVITYFITIITTVIIVVVLISLKLIKL